MESQDDRARKKKILIDWLGRSMRTNKFFVRNQMNSIHSKKKKKEDMQRIGRADEDHEVEPRSEWKEEEEEKKKRKKKATKKPSRRSKETAAKAPHQETRFGSCSCAWRRIFAAMMTVTTALRTAQCARTELPPPANGLRGSKREREREDEPSAGQAIQPDSRS